jgi:quercetin dioxygenase-like cupin family protein
MTVSPKLAPLVLYPDAGSLVEAGLLPVVIKATPQETGGQLLVEQEIPPGGLVPVHRHEADQWSRVTKGRLHVMADGVVREIGAGGWFIRPRGVPHAVWNPTQETACHVEGTLPGHAMLDLFLAMEKLTADGLLTPAALADAAAPLGTRYDYSATASIERMFGVSAGPGWRQ